MIWRQVVASVFGCVAICIGGFYIGYSVAEARTTSRWEAAMEQSSARTERAMATAQQCLNLLQQQPR